MQVFLYTIFALMNYQQTIDYLYTHLPMFSRIGAAAYKEDLHNTLALCKALDDPHKKFKSIHIAGTNGKGSTSHMLAALLQQAGYKTGLYTSPHLKDFRERIKVNGEMVSEDFVTAFVARTKELSEKIQPSFFELTVAMAFEYFVQQHIDIAVIETGLGGRLDSTNVIDPIISVITNIGYDHMNILGNTLEEIASEKAGIIKPDTPVIIGESLPETRSVFINKARAMNAPIYFAQEEYEVSNIVCSARALCCDVRSTAHDITESFVLDLNGLYQTKNLCTVLCTEGILMEHGFSIKNMDEKFALAHTKKLTGLYGRWDLIYEKPDIILDVAHNEDGIRQILEQLAMDNRQWAMGNEQLAIGNEHLARDNKQLAMGNEQRKKHFVIGIVKDKGPDKILSLLPKDAAYYFTNAHIPRALPYLDLKEKAAGFELKGEGFDDVNVALEAARKNSTPDDIIIVCGSVFVVGEVNVELFS